MIAVIPHHEIAAIGYNIGAVAALCHLCDVILLQGLAIDINRAVRHLNGITGSADDSLDIKRFAGFIIRITEHHDIPCLRLIKPIGGSECKDAVACHDGIFHGARRHLRIYNEEGIDQPCQHRRQKNCFYPTDDLFFHSSAQIAHLLWVISGSR